MKVNGTAVNPELEFKLEMNALSFDPEFTIIEVKQEMKMFFLGIIVLL